MKRFNILAVVLAFSLCLCAILANCGESNSKTGSITSITLKYNDGEITGDSLTVLLSASPLTFTADVQVSGEASKNFTLTSSDPGIASVSEKTVTLLAEGQTTITATASGDASKKHAITLNVNDTPASPGLIPPYNITNNFAEDASSGFLVQWHNSDNVTEQKLQIVKETGSFGSPTTITVTGVPFQSSGVVGAFASRNIFKAQVTNLSANTRYKYRIGNKGAWSDTFYHLTSTQSATDFSFTVVFDPQSEAHVDMTNAMRAADAFDDDNRFYLMGGDLVDEIAKRPNEIVSYTNAANEFNIKRPIVATQGNHDTYYDGSLNGTDNQYRFGEATVFNKFITFPDNGWDTHADKANRSQSYYFYYNKVFIIVLNTMATSNNAGTADPNHTKQAEWLKKILETDRAEKLSRYTIVVTHISPFSGRSVDRWQTPGVRTAYCKIFSDYSVDIVFAGHDHVYGRSNPFKTGTSSSLTSIDFSSTPGGTIYSIGGTTGPKFYTIDDDNGISKYFTVRSDGFQPGMFINVKVTASKLIVTAKSVNGNIVDTYEVNAK